MIRNKKELNFYIQADRIMNGYPAHVGFRESIEWCIRGGGRPIDFLRLMRTYSYYKKTTHSRWSLRQVCKMYYSLRLRRMGVRLGFSIGPDCLGYGVVIPHYGTIVVNNGVKIGNFAVLHTSTCIGGANKIIGDGLYLSSGAMVMGKLTLGDNVSIASNSLVNKSFESNMLLAGTPATVKRIDYPAWYIRDGEKFSQRVARVERLRQEMGLTL